MKELFSLKFNSHSCSDSFVFEYGVLTVEAGKRDGDRADGMSVRWVLMMKKSALIMHLYT